MMTEYNIDGHTVEIYLNGTGSIDPWSEEYARSIDISIMCTADMCYFMRIDKNQIYKIRDYSHAKEFQEMAHGDVFNTWNAFLEKWLNPKLSMPFALDDFGTMEDAIKHLDESKKRSLVWKSIPEKKRRETYEYLKTLTKEEKDKWYENKTKELGI